MNLSDDEKLFRISLIRFRFHMKYPVEAYTQTHTHRETHVGTRAI